MSEAQPTMTWTYLQRAKKRREKTNNKQIFRLFYNMRQTVVFSNTFSAQQASSIALRRIMVKTERQASIIMRQASIIMCIFYGI